MQVGPIGKTPPFQGQGGGAGGKRGQIGLEFRGGFW